MKTMDTRIAIGQRRFLQHCGDAMGFARV